MKEVERNDLPPANAVAHGLHVTDEEWKAICAFLMSEPGIKNAWIFGSRWSGVRIPKDPPEPLDIDLAIELSWPDDRSAVIDLTSALRSRATAALKGHNVQIDWHGLGDASDSFNTIGLRIWTKDDDEPGNR